MDFLSAEGRTYGHVGAEGGHQRLHFPETGGTVKFIAVQGVQAVAVLLVQLAQLFPEGDSPGGIIAEHFTDQEGSVHTVLVPDVAAGQIAVGFLKTENIGICLALLFQQANLLADVLKARKYVHRPHAVIGGDPLGQIHGDDGLDHHRVGRHFPVLFPLRADVVQQQQACFVAGQQGELPLVVLHGNAHPVAVRVSRQQQVGIAPAGILHPQGHGLPDFRVGVGAGGEVAVGQPLLLHHRHVPVAAFRQNPGHRHIARAVQGAVDNGRVPSGFLTEKHGLSLHRLQEGGEHLVRDVLNGAVFQGSVKIPPVYVGKNIQLLDFPQHLRSGLARDLAAVGSVDLVAVVFAGIVGSGYHNARVGSQIPGGEGHGGHRIQPGPQPDAHPGSGEHRRRCLCEHIGFQPGIIADDHRRGGSVCFQVVCQALGGLGHGVHIHPVGSGAQNPPKASGAEGQVPVKSILHGLVVHFPQGL